MRSSDAGWNWSETLFKESKLRKTRKSLKESKRLTESFDDMEVFMNTWANYNENGADSGITPTGWMSIDDAIEYCEEYADYEPFINDTDNVPFDDINEYSNASSVLQELKELQESDVDEDVVAAIVEATGYGIKEAVEIAERGDYYWYPGISSYTDLAYEVIDEVGGLKDALGDRIINYIDEDQMRREYRWDIREIMRDTAEQEVDDAHEGEDEDSYDREQEIEDWMDEHEDEYLDMIIDEDIRMAEAGEIDLSNYFDYEAFGRDLSFDGYTIVDGGIILVN
jgi:antirestriction protein